MEQKRSSKGQPAFIIAIIAVTLLVAALIGVLVWWQTGSETFYARRLDAALARGDYDSAAAIAKKMGDADAGLKVTYEKAASLYANGNYDGAKELFSSLGEYQDSRDMVNACSYASACAMMEQENYAAAADLFNALGGYQDSLSRYDECRYRSAKAFLDAGDQQEAFSLFLALGDYQDAAALAKKIAVDITGEQDAEQALLLAQGYSAEDWELMAALDELRASLPAGRIASGWSHAVILLSDGTVAAYGSNDYGECDTSAWGEITAVAAGAHHTLALTKDGTVLSCGDNQYGQCNTADWTDCTAIIAGDYDSFAITSSGTILHTGYTEFSSVSDWTDIICFAAGNCCASAIRNGGSVLCSFLAGAMDPQSTACGIACNLGWTAVLLQNGRVISGTVDTENWTGVLSLASSSTVLCGVRMDGTVHALALMRGGEKLAAELQGLSNVAAIEPAGSWALILYQDGTIGTAGKLPEALQNSLQALSSLSIG